MSDLALGQRGFSLEAGGYALGIARGGRVTQLFNRREGAGL